jgi:AraC family transcriptional regulator
MSEPRSALSSDEAAAHAGEGLSWQARGARKLAVEGELQLPLGHVLIARLNHPSADEHMFSRPDVFWVDLCLTPRRPDARARYVDRWGPHRFARMGSLIALPPRFNLHLKSEGGRHLSLICALRAEAVERWLPVDFEWTDRRLEACLDVSSVPIRNLMRELFAEMRRDSVGQREFAEALVLQISIETARHLIGASDSIDGGGLAAWRLRVIDKRMAQPGPLPTLVELASLCDISVRQLTRAFRTSRGSSLRDYMALNRIERAKRQLGTSASLKSIGISLGFSSQSTFTFAFRQATGLTPSDFRKRLLRAVRDPPGGE